MGRSMDRSVKGLSEVGQGPSISPVQMRRGPSVSSVQQSSTVSSVRKSLVVRSDTTDGAVTVSSVLARRG